MSLSFTDQMQRTITLERPPVRIVSLVPSQTELLHDLGLENEVVGITKFCVHPESWFRSKARVGGTKQLHFEKIAALQPDLIIGNKEENEQQQIETLMQEFPVWMSNIHDLSEAMTMIRAIGTLTSREEKANAIAAAIESRFQQLEQEIQTQPMRSAAYFIWKNPWMTAGHRTFIDHLLERCRLRNVFEKEESRYPEVTLEQLRDASPEVVLLSSEPYPFKEKHITEIQEVLPHAAIRTVDGELFSWYGSRLLEAPAYFNKLLRSL